MRRISWIFVVLLGFGVGEANAQSDPKKWDVAVSAALFEANPNVEGARYDDEWYFHGRYAVTVGHYWTEHLKTEVEYATSGEGTNFHQEYKSLPGIPAPYPYYFESFHRLEQASVRMVWQFGENSWVHPYVSGGLVGDRERQRVHIPVQYQYPGGGSVPNRVLVVDELQSGPTREYRLGATAGAGAKFYMSRNAFFNTGFIGTWSQPAATVSLFAGFGIDF